LDAILAVARDRAAAVRERETELIAAARDATPARGFSKALADSALSVVAEIKRRSPSAGDLAPGLVAADQAVEYQRGGAAALSVLTEPVFFGGSMEDLVAAREAVELPVLRKDFTVAPAQVWEARAAGADAILVIVAVLDDDTLTMLMETAAAAGLDTLVEVHNERDVFRALEAGAALIGVNNRDLETFTTDPEVAERLAPLLGGAAVTVAESGVSDIAVARRMKRAGYSAILVGEALVRHADPARFVAQLRGAP